VGVLDAIRDRVRAGSSVKAGWFELGESPPAQPIEMQRKELQLLPDDTPKTGFDARHALTTDTRLAANWQ
jgi:hypothetical protein